MSTILELPLEEQTLSQLHRIATIRGTSVERVAGEVLHRFAVEESAEERTEQKLDREIAAYHTLHPVLFERFAGQYVAIHNGRIIDSDADQIALFLRIKQRYSNESVLIRQVQHQPERALRVRSPKIVHE